MSVALCAMAVEALGYPVISLTGWQAGMVTNTVARNARIKKVDTERIETELNQKKIVIVTGFQGINRYEDITTLGRGGSDTDVYKRQASLPWRQSSWTVCRIPNTRCLNRQLKP